MSENSNKISKVMLPELNHEDRKLAESYESKSWALEIMDPGKHGSFGWVKGMGVALQNVGDHTLRCICVYDDEPAILNLAIINASVEAVGGHLEFGNFTIFKEWIPDEPNVQVQDEQTPPPTGMEVA